MLCVGILTLVGVVFSTGGSESPDTTDSIIEELTIYYDSLTQDELEVAAELVSVAIQQKQTQQKNFANQIMANKDQTDNNQLGGRRHINNVKIGQQGRSTLASRK